MYSFICSGVYLSASKSWITWICMKIDISNEKILLKFGMVIFFPPEFKSLIFLSNSPNLCSSWHSKLWWPGRETWSFRRWTKFCYWYKIIGDWVHVCWWKLKKSQCSWSLIIHQWFINVGFGLEYCVVIEILWKTSKYELTVKWELNNY